MDIQNARAIEDPIEAWAECDFAEANVSGEIISSHWERLESGYVPVGSVECHKLGVRT
ncbi:MAG: hypothetical protein L0I80_00455 [Brevibacterium sp.]|uniref:hypothetical protein n=1 Tax=Brevibacterium sp. TaxID=1701 RepID=UPI0026495815|nr:hypothetical protein [Brevibacterium sp.]MDN5806531.1 hypothetical protein [Brevibacterium sp.]MDN5833137.1 hypothetical protein [Brevibacterium sp.]MDN5876929.1 hypothetical protein [Brevibacterium sp.]MDN5908688.1 hypothetical protein [Brevibacterium sp.]MDN6122329.1 hypothetical protein [Brevibacterium sp.]